MIVDNPPPLAPETSAPEPPPLPLAGVRQDMADIFGEASAPSLPPSPKTMAIPLKGGIAPIRTAKRRGITTPVLAAATAGLLIGMAGMGALDLTSLRVDRALVPISAPASGVADNPFERADAPRTTTGAPATDTQRPSTRTPTSAAPPKAAEPDRPQPAPDKPDTAPAKVAAAPERHVPQHSAGEKCEGDRLERAWCMRHDILEADRRLRRAYADAIRHGVERRYLVIHQRSWSRLRARAERDPDGVLEGYRELAGDLERLSVNGRAANRIR